MNSEDVLFITLDSCRYDTFKTMYDQNLLPNISKIGQLFKATSPSHFTYGSHSCFWMGFTPGIADSKKPYLNPKFAKIFRMTHKGLAANDRDLYALEGKNIIDGFKNKGYFTIGTGAVEWFNPETETGSVLSKYFDKFFFAQNTWSLDNQLRWLMKLLNNAEKQKKIFCFINIGETHVPYWHEGADWNRWPSPCIPFGGDNCSAHESRMRQQKCLTWVDAKLKDILEKFEESTIIICADHGDCWGEDGLWEHGISHEKTLTVPLLLKTKGKKVELEKLSAKSNKFRIAASSLKNRLFNLL